MKTTLLFLLATIARFAAADALPPEMAAAKARYATDLASLQTPFTESYAWQLEAAMRTEPVRSNPELLRGLDAELQRIGARKSDPFPKQLQGTWTNNKTTPFEGQAIAISPDGRAVLIGTMFLGRIRLRYFAEERLLRATVLGPEEDTMFRGRPFITIDAQLAPDDKSFTISAVTSLISHTALKNTRFSHAGTNIPEEAQKLLK